MMNKSTQPPIVIIACRVFEHFLESYFHEAFMEQVTYLDYGLHDVPRNLKKSLQEQIDRIEQPSLIVLGYGLCGNGLHGIKAGQHTLLVPRTDDCISIFYGSYATYREQFDRTPGTYYLTKGWLESGSNPLGTYQKYVEKYGQNQADWLVDQLYQNYHRLAFVAHEQADLDHYRAKALEIAQFCQRWGMRYEEILGSDDYVRKLIEVAQDLSKTDGDFVVVQPGGTLDQSQFIR